MTDQPTADSTAPAAPETPAAPAAPASRVEDAKEAGLLAPPPKITPEELVKIQQGVEALIDEFMKSVGYAKPEERTDEKGWRYFNLNSAQGRAGVVRSEEDLFLRVESPLMALPSDRDLILPLLRNLLELNLIMTEEARLGLQGNTVYLALTTQVAGLTKEDIPRCINTVMKVADNLDDKLAERYGGTSKKRK